MMQNIYTLYNSNNTWYVQHIQKERRGKDSYFYSFSSLFKKFLLSNKKNPEQTK